MYLLPYLVCLITIILIKRWFDNKKYKDIEKIPGPPTKFFFGNALDFGTNNIESCKAQLEIQRTYGPFVRLWIGNKLTILLSDPDKMEQVLTSNVHINKSTSYDGFKFWLGNGLVNSGGDYWRKHRKLITPAFHFKILEQYVDFFKSNLGILINNLKKHVGEKSFNIDHYIHLYNLDVISETAMLTKINAQTNPKHEYLTNLSTFLGIFMQRIFSFYKGNNTLFKLTPDYRKQMQCVKVLHALTDRVISQRKEERAKRAQKSTTESKNEFGIKSKIAFLDLLLDLQEASMLTDEEIREEVDTFMFTVSYNSALFQLAKLNLQFFQGHDTVSSTVSFCLLNLAANPDIQQRLYEEIMELFPDDDTQMTMQNLQAFDYLERVIKESIRMYTTVPFVERKLGEDITFDGILIPAGSIIALHFFALHNDEKWWPNPEKFDPDRFLPDAVAKRHNFAYLPFSAGPRNCIGFRYAMLSAKSTLINILKNFKLYPAEPKFSPLLSNVAILKSENGIKLRLEHRNNA